jgi:hypothetical protein
MTYDDASSPALPYHNDIFTILAKGNASAVQSFRRARWCRRLCEQRCLTDLHHCDVSNSVRCSHVFPSVPCPPRFDVITFVRRNWQCRRGSQACFLPTVLRPPRFDVIPFPPRCCGVDGYNSPSVLCPPRFYVILFSLMNGTLCSVVDLHGWMHPSVLCPTRSRLFNVIICMRVSRSGVIQVGSSPEQPKHEILPSTHASIPSLRPRVEAPVLFHQVQYETKQQSPAPGEEIDKQIWRTRRHTSRHALKLTWFAVEVVRRGHRPQPICLSVRPSVRCFVLFSRASHSITFLRLSVDSHVRPPNEGESNNHHGNKLFRADVKAVRVQWQNAEDGAKRELEQAIKDELATRGVVFVKRDERTKLLLGLTDREIDTKLRQCLREKGRDPSAFVPGPDLKPIPDKPKKCDFLFGRGGRTNSNPANVLFRSTVERYRKEYKGASAAGKGIIVAQLIGAMRSNGRRFLIRVVPKKDATKTVAVPSMRDDSTTTAARPIPWEQGWYEPDDVHVKRAVQTRFVRRPPDEDTDVSATGSSVPASPLLRDSNGRVVASEVAVAELQRLLTVETTSDVDSAEEFDVKPAPLTEKVAPRPVVSPESSPTKAREFWPNAHVDGQSIAIDGGPLVAGTMQCSCGEGEQVRWPPQTQSISLLYSQRRKFSPCPILCFTLSSYEAIQGRRRLGG